MRHHRDVRLRPAHDPLHEPVRAFTHLVVALVHRAPQFVFIVDHLAEVDRREGVFILGGGSPSIARVQPDVFPAELTREELEVCSPRLRVDALVAGLDRGVRGADALDRAPAHHQSAVASGRRGIDGHVGSAQGAHRCFQRAHQRRDHDELDPVHDVLASVVRHRAVQVFLQGAALRPSPRSEVRVGVLFGSVVFARSPQRRLTREVVIPFAVPYEVQGLGVSVRCDEEPVTEVVLDGQLRQVLRRVLGVLHLFSLVAGAERCEPRRPFARRVVAERCC